MIYLHYFTYRGHADLLTWTCRATLETLAHSPYVLGRDISIVVVDDASNPCPEAAVSELKAMGATYRTSTFKRRGNPNNRRDMCQPYDWIIRLVNTLKVVFATKDGVFAVLIAVMLVSMGVLYHDMRQYMTEQTRAQVETVRVLTELKAEISSLKQAAK